MSCSAHNYFGATYFTRLIAIADSRGRRRVGVLSRASSLPFTVLYTARFTASYTVQQSTRHTQCNNTACCHDPCCALL